MSSMAEADRSGSQKRHWKKARAAKTVTSALGSKGSARTKPASPSKEVDEARSRRKTPDDATQQPPEDEHATGGRQEEEDIASLKRKAQELKDEVDKLLKARGDNCLKIWELTEERKDLLAKRNVMQELKIRLNHFANVEEELMEQVQVALEKQRQEHHRNLAALSAALDRASDERLSWHGAQEADAQRLRYKLERCSRTCAEHAGRLREELVVAGLSPKLSRPARSSSSISRHTTLSNDMSAKQTISERSWKTVSRTASKASRSASNNVAQVEDVRQFHQNGGFVYRNAEQSVIGVCLLKPAPIVKLDFGGCVEYNGQVDELLSVTVDAIWDAGVRKFRWIEPGADGATDGGFVFELESGRTVLFPASKPFGLVAGLGNKEQEQAENLADFLRPLGIDAMQECGDEVVKDLRLSGWSDMKLTCHQRAELRIPESARAFAWAYPKEAASTTPSRKRGSTFRMQRRKSGCMHDDGYREQVDASGRTILVCDHCGFEVISETKRQSVDVLEAVVESDGESYSTNGQSTSDGPIVSPAANLERDDVVGTAEQPLFEVEPASKQLLRRLSLEGVLDTECEDAVAASLTRSTT